MIVATFDVDGKLDFDEGGNAGWPAHVNPQVVPIGTERFIESVVVLCNYSVLARSRRIGIKKISQPLLEFTRIGRRPSLGQNCISSAAQGIFELS